MAEKSILRLKAVIERTGLSKSFIYENQKNGSFPKSVVLGPRAIGFYSDVIDNWIAERANVSKADISLNSSRTSVKRTT
jgi:prophage regulatory protein